MRAERVRSLTRREEIGTAISTITRLGCTPVILKESAPKHGRLSQVRYSIAAMSDDGDPQPVLVLGQEAPPSRWYGLRRAQVWVDEFIPCKTAAPKDKSVA